MAQQARKPILKGLPQGIRKVKNIIAIGSGKGGVGKSTISTILAYGLKQQGHSVGLLDADIYGPSQLLMMGRPDSEAKSENSQMAAPLLKNGIKYISMAAFKEGDEAAILRAPMVVKWLQFFLGGMDWGELDYLLIDLPPGTGDIQLTMAQQTYLNGAVIVTTSNDVACEVAKKGLEMFRKVNVPIVGIIDNMKGFVCNHCSEITPIFQGEGAKALSDSLSIPLLGEIPLYPQLSQLKDGIESFMQTDSGTIVKEKIEQLNQSFADEYQKVQVKNKQIEPKTMELLADHRLHLKWEKGPDNVYDSYLLRINCACAACINEVTGEAILDPASVPKDVYLIAARPMGRYGLSLHFSDHHKSGIYRYDRLKELKAMAFGQAINETISIQKPATAPTQEQFKCENPQLKNEVESLLQKDIAPALAAHGGHISILGIQDQRLKVVFGGGCQGCGQINTTLKEGVEKLVAKHFPSIKGIDDLTDHDAGTNPYYT